jgi:oligoendopeptidase F
MAIEPDWDMTPYFPEFDGSAYRDFRASLATDVADLQAELRAVAPLSDQTASTWAALLVRLEEIASRSAHLHSYLGCMGAADGRDEGIQREAAAAAVLAAEISKVFVAVRAAFREVEGDVFQHLLDRPELAAAAYYLERVRRRAEWSMSEPLETLAADLGVTGISAWGRLYDQVSGKLEFELKPPGQAPRRLPVSMTRTLLEDASREVRTATLEGSNAAWEGIGDVAAACLNAIAGTRLELYRRRRVDHFLEPAVFDAGISRRTLDTMLEVVRSRWEVPRRYLRRKARILGLERLGFQDLMAPLPVETQARFSWEDARERVLSAFGDFYPGLGDFAQQAFERRWIDYQTRPGKRPGGFCSTSKLIGQSRVFMTYNGALGDVSTLAHELGHAFHSWVLAGARLWACRYPMTLAETASTFAEQLVIDAVLESPDARPEDRAAMLDSRMQDGSAFLLNIPMRFLFEREVYEERAAGELTVSRLCELMAEVQRTCYGDCLSEDELDPWFWASKLHFYLTGISFYNFPYTFGYLFSLGIFARAKRESPSFFPVYEKLLQMTGSDSAENLARSQLGIDLEAPDFWNASIDLIESDLARFEEATGALFD